MLTPLETQLKALAHARQALQDAITALSDTSGTGWTRNQDRLATMSEELFDMDYDLGYEYRDAARDRGERADVAPDGVEYWQMIERV